MELNKNKFWSSHLTKLLTHLFLQIRITKKNRREKNSITEIYQNVGFSLKQKSFS